MRNVLVSSLRIATLSTLVLAACTGSDDDADDSDDADTDSCAFERPIRGAPQALQAGVATRRIPAPVGIGTAGYGPTGAPSSESPFSDIYPGTKRIHGHPEIKAVVLSRGEGHEAIFVRLDAVGMFSQLRNDVVTRLESELGRNLDHALLLGATHSHSGPGRVVNTGSSDVSFFDLIADRFDPEFYERFVDDVVQTVAAAYDDLAPAELGAAEALCPDGHSDRRCEDGLDYENGSLPLLAVRRGGEVEAVVFSYAIHGTVRGLDDLYLGQDVSGAIEEALEDRYDHPVEALFFNSWGADMSPGSPQGIATDPDAADRGGDFVRMRVIGEAVAQAVDDVVGGMQYADDPEIQLETHRYVINREAIGYDDQTFAQYPTGGVFCGLAGDVDCVEGERAPRIEDLDKGCVPFPETFPAPSQSSTTVGRVGPFTILTYPGEAGTLLAEGLIQDLQARYDDVVDVMFLGYTQDYLGYGIEEEDWWSGGYEASGALWGPRQGEYLMERIAAAYDSFAAQSCPSEEPDALVPFPYTIDAPYQAVDAVQAATVATDVQSSYDAAGMVSWTFRGRDPWLGAPEVVLQTAAGDAVSRPNGMPVTGDDYNLDVELTVDPPWEEAATQRTFLWRVRLPVTQPVGGVSLTPGDYRLRATVPAATGGGDEVTSAVFTIADGDDTDTDA